MKKEINIETSSKYLNLALTTNKLYTREEIKDIVYSAIPLKSVDQLIAEMGKDNVFKLIRNKRKIYYQIQYLPIYKNRIQNWINSVRKNAAIHKQKHTLTPEGVSNYLKNLSSEDFLKFIKPICQQRGIKLLKPSGFNSEEIFKLPPEVLEKILKYDEI